MFRNMFWEKNTVFIMCVCFWQYIIESVNIKKMLLMWVRVANMLCGCLLVPIPSLRAFTIAAFRWEIPLNQKKNTTV